MVLEREADCHRAWIYLKRVCLHMVSSFSVTIRGGSPRSVYRAPCFQCGNYIIDHDIAAKARIVFHPSVHVHISNYCRSLLCISLSSLPVSSDADISLSLALRHCVLRHSSVISLN